MKEIKTVFKSFMLENVLRELHGIKNLPGCILSKVSAYGRSNGKQAREQSDESAEMSKLEIVVKDAQVEDVLRAIQKGAHTGNPGDGKIFVVAVDAAIAIRTGTRGEGVL